MKKMKRSLGFLGAFFLTGFLGLSPASADQHGRAFGGIGTTFVQDMKDVYEDLQSLFKDSATPSSQDTGGAGGAPSEGYGGGYEGFGSGDLDSEAPEGEPEAEPESEPEGEPEDDPEGDPEGNPEGDPEEDDEGDCDDCDDDEGDKEGYEDPDDLWWRDPSSNAIYEYTPPEGVRLIREYIPPEGGKMRIFEYTPPEGVKQRIFEYTPAEGYKRFLIRGAKGQTVTITAPEGDWSNQARKTFTR